jgi:cytochrome c553
MPSENTQVQLILNGNSSVNLLINADSNYISKAMQAIKNTMLGSPAALCIKILKYLNAINAILSKENAQLVATVYSYQQAKTGKQNLGKARVLTKEDAEKLHTKAEAEKETAIAKKIAME